MQFYLVSCSLAGEILIFALKCLEAHPKAVNNMQMSGKSRIWHLGKEK